MPPALAAALLAAALAGCGAGRPPASAATPARLAVARAQRSAEITLRIAGGGAAQGYTLNGSVKGGLLYSVPERWTVRVRLVNRGAGARFSCVLEPAPGTSARVPAAIAQPRPRAGVAPGRSAIVSFGAPAAPALYRLEAVAGAGQPTGLWVSVEVTRGGSPSVRRLR